MQLLRCWSGGVRNAVIRLRYCGISPGKLHPQFYFLFFLINTQLKRRGRSGGITRVVCRTFASRGKSFTPESRMDMLEERNWVLDRREETQDDKGFDIIIRPLKITRVLICM